MKNTRVLVVDDDARFGTALVQSLELHGMSAEQEAESLNVEKRIRNNEYDVIVLDVIMPSYDGVDVMLDISTFKPASRVLLTTSLGGKEEQIHECTRLGACAFVEKNPEFPPDTYVNKVLEVAKGPPASVKDDVRRELVIHYLWRRTMYVRNRTQKGRILEKLVKNILDSVSEFRDVETHLITGSGEEIDIEFELSGDDSFWHSYGSLAYAECKNWSDKTGAVDTGEFHKFFGKLQGMTGCKLGFFVSTNGFTKAFKSVWLETALGGIVVVPINLKGLEELVNNENRESVLRKFIRNAVRHVINS